MNRFWNACATRASLAVLLAGSACGGEKAAEDAAVGEAADAASSPDTGADTGSAADTARLTDSDGHDAASQEVGGADSSTADSVTVDAGGADTGCSKGCSDGNPCTDDSCVGTNCTHTPNGGSCDDGDPCTAADHCSLGNCAGSKQYWVKEFGGAGDDAGLAVAITGTDIVVVGYAGGGTGGGTAGGTPGGSGDRYSTFTRLDKLGSTKSQESYPLVGNDELTALVANGTGWLAVGTAVQASKAMESRALLVDENGSLVKQLALGAGELYGVAAVQGGGFLAAGYREDAQGNLKLLLMKLASDGTKEWEQLHGTSEFEVAWGLAALPDGGAVTIGDTAPGGVGPHLSLQRFDAAGKATWQRTFADAGQDNGWAVARLLGPAGALDGYVLAGSRKEPGAKAARPWLMRVDTAGKAQWQSFAAGEDAGAARAVVVTETGVLAAAGARYVGLKQEFALWTLTGAGGLGWSHVAGAGEARAIALQAEALVLVGSSASGAEAGNLKVLRIPVGGPGKCGP